MIHKNENEVRTWEVNADEFGAIIRGNGGWALAQLVACSVFSGKPTDKINSAAAELGKASTSAFANRSGVSQDVVAKFLAGWGQAIDNGAPVPSADELGPTDVGTFPLPARPFNGKGGYVSTKNMGNGGADTQVENIVKGGTLTNTIAKSPDALKAIIEAAAKGPGQKALAHALEDMSDDAFEVVSEAYTAVTTPAQAEVKPTGVKPAYTPPPAKVKAAEKAAGKIHQAKVQKTIEDLKAKAAPIIPEIRPDGGKSPNQLLLEMLHAADKLWDTEGVIHFLDKVYDAVLTFPGPLDQANEEFLEERLGIMKTKIAMIENAVEAKKGSTVPDTIPDNWT